MLLRLHPEPARGRAVCFSIKHPKLLWRKSLSNQTTLLSHITMFFKFPETFQNRRKMSALVVLELYRLFGKGVTGVKCCTKHTLIAK